MPNKEPKKCFVIMPFGDETQEEKLIQDMYELAVKEAVKLEAYSCSRSDEITQTGMVLEQIVKSISEADAVIADLTFSNPNVMYELGMAHAFAKPVILIVQDAKKVPFDISNYRFIQYSTQLGGDQKLLAEVREMLGALSDPEQAAKMRTNPVHLFLPELYEWGGYTGIVEQNRGLSRRVQDLERLVADRILENFGPQPDQAEIESALKAQALPQESIEGVARLVFKKIPKNRRVKFKKPKD